MNWIDEALNRLASADAWGYQERGPGATEPTALTALSLIAHKKMEPAKVALDWLVAHQRDDGALDVTAEESSPGWATPLAVLAWAAAVDTGVIGAASRYQTGIKNAVSWMLTTEGLTSPKLAEAGHDSMLLGWPWVIGTHSWIEPTAICVLALKRAGLGDHKRTREAVRMLIDRQLETGGCNYGNTTMLGQTLRPHLEPTGVALAALAGEDDPSGRISRSIAYARRQLTSQTTSASLSYAILGLTAQGVRPAETDVWLSAAASRSLARDRGAYKLALLTIAVSEKACRSYSQPAEVAQV